MNRRILKTIYSDILNINSMLGIPYLPNDNTTLNEKYNIATLKYNSMPKIEYFSIGLPVKESVINGEMDMSEILHRPMDIDLFRPIPFLIKPKELGITSKDLENYRLIVERTIGNITYNLFYLKRITNVSTNQKIYIVNREGSKDTIELFEPTKYNILEPSPVITENLYPDKLEFILYNKRIDITITADEVLQIKDAIALLYPDLPVSIKNNIAEIGLVQGIDAPYKDRLELYNAQIAYFISTNNLISKTILNGENINEIIELNSMRYIPQNSTI